MVHAQNQTASFFLYVLLLCHFHTLHERLGHDLGLISGQSRSVHHAHPDTAPTAQSPVITKPTEVSRFHPHKSAKQR